MTKLWLVVLVLAAAVRAEDEPVAYSIRGKDFTESEMASWHNVIAAKYTIMNGKAMPLSDERCPYEAIDGRVFQVLDEKRVLLDLSQGDLAPLQIICLSVPTSTDGVAQGDPVRCLGMRYGSAEYMSVAGANRQAPHYVYLPRMTRSEFMAQLALRWFPEMILKEKTHTPTVRRARTKPRLNVWSGVGGGRQLKR